MKSENSSILGTTTSPRFWLESTSLRYDTESGTLGFYGINESVFERN